MSTYRISCPAARAVAVTIVFVITQATAQGDSKWSRQVVDERDDAQLVLLPGGAFKVGSTQSEVRNLVTNQLKQSWRAVFGNDLPVKVLVFPDLYIDKFEVTNKQYAAFARATGRKPSRFSAFPQFNSPKQPVTGVSWSDSEAYCKWAGRRLPSEQEWERAARGDRASPFPWGHEPDSTRLNGAAQNLFAPTYVGSFPRGDTPDGVSDLAGNVAEYTASKWPDGASVTRGGSFFSDLGHARTTVRMATGQTDGAENVGFRCIVDAAAYRAR